MDGVTIHQYDGVTVCKILCFSDELKGHIRSNLSALCYGKATVDEDASYYSYERTIRKFMSVFENKLSEKQRMGVIGELLAHVLISHSMPHLSAVTLIMSKEEEQIHKGFDFIYISSGDTALWYGEAKSGGVQNQSPTQKNISLLNSAKSGIVEYLRGSRDKLWDSAIIEANQTLATDKSLTVRGMLRNDLLALRGDGETNKNALIVSILFHDISNPFEETILNQYLQDIKNEDIFEDVILFSIQKSTYHKVVDFLQNEARI